MAVSQYQEPLAAGKTGVVPSTEINKIRAELILARRRANEIFLRMLKSMGYIRHMKTGEICAFLYTDSGEQVSAGGYHRFFCIRIGPMEDEYRFFLTLKEAEASRALRSLPGSKRDALYDPTFNRANTLQGISWIDDLTGDTISGMPEEVVY